MTFYCCKHVDEERNLVLNYVRTKGELMNACCDVRRQGFVPIKTVINLSDDGKRTETALK